jgi:putative SOS response-associated peptidase YedK
VCGRFALREDRYEVAKQFHVDDVVADEMPPRYNVAPCQKVLAVATSRDGTVRRLGTFRWGLVPSWATDPSMGYRMANARAESADTKPAFRRAFATRRCLIPASGYYEWKVRETAGPGGGRPHKIPFYFHRRDGMLIALGGLWEVWHGDDEVLRTCTVLTTDSNATNAPIHERMPVIVREELWDHWLAPEPLGPTDREAVLAPAPDDLLVVERVSESVNSPRNEGAALIEPVGQSGERLRGAAERAIGTHSP